MEPAWSAETRNVVPTGSRPMIGGLGRELRVRRALEVLPLAERRDLLAALDEVMQPMSARALDEALMATGLSRADRKRLVAALKPFALLMVVER